jgi:hypothetical protein
MSKPTPDELPTLDPSHLAGVTGGAVSDTSSMMLPMIMMMAMRGRGSSPQVTAAPAPAAPQPAAPVRPKILVNGVEQTGTPGPNGGLTFEI